MLTSWRTIRYFVWQGYTYGFGLGGIAGTFVFPIFGTIFGIMVGMLFGPIMGLVLGVGVHLYNRHAYRRQMDFADYQANLASGAGWATALVTAIFMVVMLLSFAGPDTKYIIALLILIAGVGVAPLAGLAAAYVAHRYAEMHAQHIIKRKNEALLPDTHQHLERVGVVEKFVDLYLSKTKWLLWLVAMGAFAQSIFSRIQLGYYGDMGSVLLNASLAALGIGFAGVIVGGLVGATNGTLIQMLNRVAFSPQWTKEQYKRRVMVIAGLFTLVITPVVGLVVGAPVLAILAVLASRDYADWYYDGDEKAKHDLARLEDKPKNEALDYIAVEQDEKLVRHE